MKKETLLWMLFFKKKVRDLPIDKQQEVKDFVNYLLEKYAQETNLKESVSSIRKRNLGKYKGEIWIAEDFNDTPKEFKGYL